MNCPNCGAANDEDARFCAECGTPLESQATREPLIIDQVPEVDDSDRTLLSSRYELEAEEAKTVSMSQEDVVEAAAEAEVFPSSYQVETEAPPPPISPSLTGNNDQAGKSFWSNQRNLIIIAVVVLLLCCCCAAVLIGSAIALNGGNLNLNNLSLLPLDLPLV